MVLAMLGSGLAGGLRFGQCAQRADRDRAQHQHQAGSDLPPCRRRREHDRRERGHLLMENAMNTGFNSRHAGPFGRRARAGGPRRAGVCASATRPMRPPASRARSARRSTAISAWSGRATPAARDGRRHQYQAPRGLCRKVRQAANATLEEYAFTAGCLAIARTVAGREIPGARRQLADRARRRPPIRDPRCP